MHIHIYICIYICIYVRVSGFPVSGTPVRRPDAGVPRSSETPPLPRATI